MTDLDQAASSIGKSLWEDISLSQSFPSRCSCRDLLNARYEIANAYVDSVLYHVMSAGAVLLQNTCDNTRFCIPERNSKTNNNPAQNASSANAYSNISLDKQEDYCSPEDNFQAIQNGVCFETLPPAEARHVLGEELISDEDNGFRRLEGGRRVSKLFFFFFFFLFWFCASSSWCSEILLLVFAVRK